MTSTEIYCSDKPSFTLNWHDNTDMATGVIEAAHHAINKTVEFARPDCVFQSGALEHLIKVPEIGMVYIVVSSIEARGKFTVHASKSRQTMMEIFEDCQSMIS